MLPGPVVGKGLDSSSRRQDASSRPPERCETSRRREASLPPRFQSSRKTQGGRHHRPPSTSDRSLKGMCEQMLAAQRRSTYADFGSGGLFKDVMGPYFHVWQARRGGGTSVPACCSTTSAAEPAAAQYFGGRASSQKQYHCVGHVHLLNINHVFSSDQLSVYNHLQKVNIKISVDGIASKEYA